MRVRVLLNLVLLVTVAALGAWIWHSSQGGGTIAAQPIEQIRRVAIEPVGGERLVLSREGENWRLEEPLPVLASDFHVERVLDFLALEPDTRYNIDELDLDAVGLREPWLRLRFDGEVLEFGRREPLRQRRYLRRGEEVMLVLEGASTMLAAPWWNFIDRRLLPPNAGLQSLHWRDGRSSDNPQQMQLWREAVASIVKPESIAATADFHLRLASGERLPFAILPGKPARLLRTDLGLAYELDAELLNALTQAEAADTAL